MAQPVTFRTQVITRPTKNGGEESRNVRVPESPKKIGVQTATAFLRSWIEKKAANSTDLKAAMAAATREGVFYESGSQEIKTQLATRGVTQAMITTAWSAFTLVRYLGSVPDATNDGKRYNAGKGTNKGPFHSHQSRVESEITRNPDLRFGMAIHGTGTGKTCTMIAALRGLASRGKSKSSNGPRTRQSAAKNEARRAAAPITQFVFVAPNSSIKDQIIDSLKHKCSGMPDLELTTNDECRLWSGLELRSAYLDNLVVRVAFVTQNTLVDISYAQMDWAWPSKSSAAVFVDEAHKFFLNSSLPKHMAEACGEHADHVTHLLLSSRAADRAILWLSGTAFVLAATATPYQNTPNDISFYLDCLSYMTYPRPSTDASMISVVGRVVHEDDPNNPERSERAYWNNLKAAWASSLVQNKGFVSFYMPKVGGGNMPDVNSSRLPFDIGATNAARVPLRGAWLDRVVSIPIEDVRTLRTLRSVEAGLRPAGPSGRRSVVELMPLYKIINPLKVPRMLEVSKAQYAKDKGPILFFSNFIAQGTKLLAEALRQEGCIEIIPSGRLELSPVYGFINWLAANLRDPQNADALGNEVLMQKAASIFARLAGYVAAVRHGGSVSGNKSPNQSNGTAKSKNALPNSIKRDHSWATWLRKLIPLRRSDNENERSRKRSFAYKLTHMEEQMRERMPGLPKNGVFIRIEGATPDDRILAIKYVFNAPANHAGDYIKYAVISKAGATGIDYKNIKQVHIMDSDFLPTTLIQAVGRATRQGSLLASAAETQQKGTVRMYAYATYVPGEGTRVPSEFRGMSTVNIQTYDSTALKFKHSVGSMQLLSNLSIENGGARPHVGDKILGICRAHHFENSVPPPRIIPRPRTQMATDQPVRRRRSREDSSDDSGNGKRQRSDLGEASRKQGGSGFARASKALGGRNTLISLYRRNSNNIDSMQID